MRGLLTSGLLGTMLLQQQEGAYLQKRRQWHTRSDVRDRVMVLTVEAADQMENLLPLRDGLAEVAELVGEALEAGAVLHDGHVALDDGVVLRVDVHGAGELASPWGSRREVRKRGRGAARKD
jgi:hypothetical protein